MNLVLPNLHPSPVAGVRPPRSPLTSLARLLLVLAATTLPVACDHEHRPQEGDPHGSHHGDPRGSHEHAPQGAPTKPPTGVNPVQHEMRLLHEALLGAVTAIANGKVTSVAESLHEVHGAKEHTEAALRSGAYTPPKNGQAIARFIELDEEFHSRLEDLVARSKANDVTGTAAALGRTLEGCQGCHAEFRF